MLTFFVGIRVVWQAVVAKRPLRQHRGGGEAGINGSRQRGPGEGLDCPQDATGSVSGTPAFLQRL